MNEYSLKSALPFMINLYLIKIIYLETWFAFVFISIAILFDIFKEKEFYQNMKPNKILNCDAVC